MNQTKFGNSEFILTPDAEGSKGLEDLHQFRKNLWAQDRAQPKRQEQVKTLKRPWPPLFDPQKAGPPETLPPSPAPPGETPVLSTSGRFHKTHSRGLLGSQLGAPQPSSHGGSQVSTLPLSMCTHIPPWPGEMVPKCWPEDPPPALKDILHIFHCCFITNRTIS